MAKVKTWAVTVSYTVEHTVFVEARREGGAIEKVLTDDGWREATRYNDETPMYLPKDAVVTRTRIVP